MSGRLHAKVLNTGKEAKNNTAKPLEYIVTKKWDAYTKEKKSNVDASDVSEQTELMYSRPTSGFDTLKSEHTISHDSCDESNSVISSSSSSAFSGITAEAEDRAFFGIEEKLMRLCDGMPCTKIEDIDDINDDESQVEEQMMCLYTSTAKKVGGVKSSKSHDFSRASFESKSHDFSRGTWDSRGTFESTSHDFSRGTWDSNTVEDSLGKDSASKENVKEDLFGEDELHMLERSKEVEHADGISASEKKVLKPEEIGTWLTGAIKKTGKNVHVIDKDVQVGDLVEEESPQTVEESALLVSLDAGFEKVDEDNEKGEELPGIEYTLSLVEFNAEWDGIELDVNDADGIEVIKMRPKEPHKGAGTSTTPGVENSILEQTCSLTESEGYLGDGIHATDESISLASGSRTSGRQLFKDDEVFVAPALEYTLSTLKKHKINTEAVAISTENETSEAIEDAVLASIDISARNGDDEDDLDFPSIEYALSFHEKRVSDESQAVEPAAATKTIDDNSAESPGIEYTLSFHENDASTELNTSAPIVVTKLNTNGVPLTGSQIKDPSPIPGKCETDADQAAPNQDAPIIIDQPDSHSFLPIVAGMADSCNTTGHKHRRALWKKSKRLSAAATGKSTEKTTKVTGDKSAVAKVNKNDVPLTKSKMTFDKSAGKAGSNAEKYPSPIPGKSETDGGQVSTNRDAPCLAEQPEPKNVLPIDAAMADSRKTADRKYRRSLWGRSKRSSVVSAAKTAERTTKATDDKSAVGPPAGEGSMSLDDGSVEEQKWTDLVAPKQARPSALASSKSAGRTMKATDDKSAVKPLVGEVPASLNDGSLEEQKSTHPATPERERSSTVAAAKLAGKTMKATSDDNRAVEPPVGEVPASLNNGSSEKHKSTDLVPPKQGRPFAVAAAKSAENTTKATDKSAVKPLVGEVPASLNDGPCEEQQSTDPVTPERAHTEESTFGLIHASSSPTSIADTIFAKRETHTKASTNKAATNEPETNNKISEPGTATDKASRNKGATNAQEPIGDTSEPCKGFTDGKTEANGKKALTIKDAPNEKEPKIETSEPRKGLKQRMRGRSQSVTRRRRSLSLDRRRSEPASPSTQKMDNRRFPWFSARKEQATEAHDCGKQDEVEDIAVFRRQKKTFIMVRKETAQQCTYCTSYCSAPF
jgi:hypothetical protein